MTAELTLRFILWPSQGLGEKKNFHSREWRQVRQVNMPGNLMSRCIWSRQGNQAKGSEFRIVGRRPFPSQFFPPKPSTLCCHSNARETFWLLAASLRPSDTLVHPSTSDLGWMAVRSSCLSDLSPSVLHRFPASGLEKSSFYTHRQIIGIFVQTSITQAKRISREDASNIRGLHTLAQVHPVSRR
jgi:hypothetical protein